MALSSLANINSAATFEVVYQTVSAPEDVLTATVTLPANAKTLSMKVLLMALRIELNDDGIVFVVSIEES